MKTRSRLLAGAALPLVALLTPTASVHAAAVGAIAVSRPDVPALAVPVQVDVGALQARLAQALQALEEARASGGDVAAAQAEVDAAQAELNAAMSAAPAEEPPAAEPPAEEPAPAPEEPAAPPPAAEEPQPPAAEEQVVPQEAPAEPPAEAQPERAPAPAEQAPEPPVEAPQTAPQDVAPEETPPAETAPAEEPAPADEAAPPETAPAESREPEPVQPAEEAPVEAPAATEQAPAEAAPPVEQPDEPGAPAETDAAPGQPETTTAPPPPPQVEAPSMTEEELQRARAIAEDPSQTDDTVILPVDKGAAVLDSEKEVDTGTEQSRETRRRERTAAEPTRVPESDAEAQATISGERREPVELRAVTAEEGRRIDRRPRYERPEGVTERRAADNRIVIQFGNTIVVRGDDSQRFLRDSDDYYYEELPRGRVRETVVRSDGTQVVTIRNRYGEVIQRSKIDQRGREYVLFYAPDLMEDDRRYPVFRDPGLDLPPMRLRIPVRDYIIDTSSDPDQNYYRFLQQPPVEPVERVYSLDEVKYSARIRDKVRRIDLDTITFATGSAEIPMSQARTLRQVAEAMERILDDNPAETFLIEGHTDAVGSDESNLILSDERAESVASLLTDVYGIPPENLATQGYGERYLKVRTLGPSQENRRVTIRRVTPLVRPVAANR